MSTILLYGAVGVGFIYTCRYIWYLWKKKKRLAAVELAILNLVMAAGCVYKLMS
ncbi:hypothetical protein LSG31_00045 [Fodinisporobacter ferrooxydans]|uniref:Uncharacterized protein n=1 Tax=Fodinisporobacter ferrooxydans TaxID=2901836 RepID=A0ABY4CN94_9BACL|nr:hypothetical protein LSG31_00045 [Alicyclobacillaceae bacterium MYW30-H2]